jgi:Uri superfamily endonuclease
MTSRSPGTYILRCELSSSGEIDIGRLGQRRFEPGIYAYVGSAFGPGGLDARLGRYARGPRNRHWHIDYLLEHAEMWGALASTDPTRLECAWADWLSRRLPVAVRGFGSSDCRCRSHLFFGADTRAGEEMIRAAGCELKALKLEVAHGL